MSNLEQYYADNRLNTTSGYYAASMYNKEYSKLLPKLNDFKALTLDSEELLMDESADETVIADSINRLLYGYNDIITRFDELESMF